MRTLTLLLFLSVSMSAAASQDRKIHTLFNSLDPTSVSQHLCFYELYPDTEEGKQALKRAWNLLGADDIAVPFPSYTSAQGLVSLVNKQPNQGIPHLTDSQLQSLEHIGKHLANRKLQGHKAESEEVILALPPEEIDLSRAILVSQLGDKNTILTYEAMIDLMALQIKARLPSKPTAQETIRAINHAIFEQMRFRFPPQSKYSDDIDLYTFLPSVLDSRQGVCLGVSILYLAIAQRLDLPLEAITPPGHIYIRYNQDGRVINIETTARGIHIDSEEYLGVETCALQKRTIKEVVGLAHMNMASLFIKEENYKEALKRYQKALPYLPEDKLIVEFMGYCCLMTGDQEDGKKLLEEVANDCPEYAVSKGTLPEDYLAGRVDIDGIQAIFMHVDETRESILKKKQALEMAVKTYPEFRDGWQSLGIAWLQLHRRKEALRSLEQYHRLNKENPEVEYYLAIISLSRHDYQKAWRHLREAERITALKDHHPRALKTLRRELTRFAPE